MGIEDRRKYERELIEYYVQEYLKFNGIEASENVTVGKVMNRYQIGCLWPLLWTSCTLSGIEGLLDSVNKFEPAARERTKNFMLTTASRYLQAAIDHESIKKIEQA